jgi:hypothetical protein
MNEEDFNTYKMIQNLSSNIETSLNQLESIRSMLFNTIQSFEDFINIRSDLDKILYDYETNVFMINKKVKEFINHYNSLNENFNYLNELKNKNDNMILFQNNKIGELVFNNDLQNSQINYYKKQIIEKDSFIFDLKKRIIQLEKETKGKDGFTIQYDNYNEITLPERIKKNYSDNNNNEENNLLENIDSNSNKNELNPNKKTNEYNFDYTHDLDLDKNTINNNNNIDNNIPINNNNNNENETLFKSSNKSTLLKSPNKSINESTFSRESKKNSRMQLKDIIIKVCKLSSNDMEKIENKYGKDIFNKLSTGEIEENILNDLEIDINNINKNEIKKENNLKNITKKHINSHRGSAGWETLRNYLTYGNKDKVFRKLSTNK